MSAYKIDINIQDTPEQEVFMSFQFNVLSVPLVNDNTISFKSQVTEFNGKNRTEIPITCAAFVSDIRMFGKINKLQKGNKIEVVGNLIRNNKEEIKVSVTYLVYVNTNNFSSSDKNNLSKIPWLNSSNSKKATSIDQSHGSYDNVPNFIVNHHKRIDEIENNNAEDELSDYVEGENGVV